jgi:hypothetical protein
MGASVSDVTTADGSDGTNSTTSKIHAELVVKGILPSIYFTIFAAEQLGRNVRDTG